MLPIVGALGLWEEAMQGRRPLSEALARLAHAVGAECGMIVRSRPSDPRALRIAVHDDRRGEPIRPLVTSFAESQLGAALAEARPASLWFGAAGLGEGAALADWQAARRMRDFVVLVLEAGPEARDHLELHFRQPLDAEARNALGSTLATLARGWARRNPGLVERALAGQRPQTEGRAILDTSNPMQLSRSEFRVCLLLSRGLEPEGVAAELGLARSTVRAHLRSIHAKTGTASLADLVRALADPGTPLEDKTGLA